MTSEPLPQSENDLRREIIDTCRRLDAAQLNTGRAGNLSARWHRGHADGMLITPSAMPYEALDIDDIVWMPLDQASARDSGSNDDQPVAEGERRPSSEWRMHLDLYQRADVQAVMHVHSSFATTLACLPRVQQDGIPAFHYMIAAAGGNTIRCAPYHLFGTSELSNAMHTAMQDRRACLLANHGQVATGANIAAAFELAAEVETLSKMYWQALQVSEPVILSDAQMAEVHKAFATYDYRKA